MVESIERGFRSLATYAELSQRDLAKAEAIRVEQERVRRFLAEQGLLEARSPARQIREALNRQGVERHRAWQDHLSAVAQEALRVEGDGFVHSTQVSVSRALRAKIQQGEDHRLIPDYSDSTLGRQVFRSGEVLISAIHHQGETYDSGLRNTSKPVVDLVSDQRFISRFHYKGWLDTLRAVSETLPTDVTPFELGFLLMSYSSQVGPDLKRSNSVEARLTEVRKVTRRAAA